MARIAIIGPGAIGGAIAAWLQHADQHEIILCARRPLKTITLNSPHRLITIRPKVITSSKQATPADYVLIATKTYQSPEMASWLAMLATPKTTVAILQNGVEHFELFRPYLKKHQILPVIVRIATERIQPTEILNRGTAILSVPNSLRGRSFATLFFGTPIEVIVEADFKTVLWRKLCGNAAGVLNAILLQPSGIFHDEKVFELAKGIVEESVAVGKAEGAAFDHTVVDSVLQGLRRAPRDAINSMLADRQAGRPLELDARNGVIVRLGQKHGIPTPCNQMAVSLLETMTTHSI